MVLLLCCVSTLAAQACSQEELDPRIPELEERYRREYSPVAKGEGSESAETALRELERLYLGAPPKAILERLRMRQVADLWLASAALRSLSSRPTREVVRDLVAALLEGKVSRLMEGEVLQELSKGEPGIVREGLRTGLVRAAEPGLKDHFARQLGRVGDTDSVDSILRAYRQITVLKQAPGTMEAIERLAGARGVEPALDAIRRSPVPECSAVYRILLREGVSDPAPREKALALLRSEWTGGPRLEVETAARYLAVHGDPEPLDFMRSRAEEGRWARWGILAEREIWVGFYCEQALAERGEIDSLRGLPRFAGRSRVVGRPDRKNRWGDPVEVPEDIGPPIGRSAKERFEELVGRKFASAREAWAWAVLGDGWRLRWDAGSKSYVLPEK